MKRSPIRRRPKLDNPELFWIVTGEGKRWLWPVNCMTEKEFDGTLLDWAFKVGDCVKSWHCTVATRSEAGFFDRVYIFPNRAVFAELKVRYANGKANGTSTKQDEYIYAGIAAGLDVRVWTWPDSACEAWETLTGRPLSDSPYVEMRR